MVIRNKIRKVLNPPKENLTLEKLKEDICLYVRLQDWVSIVELKRRYGSQAQGGYELTLPHSPNILLFAGLSELFCNAISDLLVEKRIHPHTSSFMVYMIDGGMLRLPLAKRMPAAGDYKIPHWLPVTFRIGAKCLLRSCPGR